MIATVTNLSATDSVDVPFPFNRTLAASGSVALGVNLADLNNGEEKGNPAWKPLNDMIKKGQISVTYADDAATRDTFDRARNA
jgi:NADPH:quinone reductase-like Zn-dependent oxidoreductase